jgi:hypothetical protein
MGSREIRLTVGFVAETAEKAGTTKILLQ